MKHKVSVKNNQQGIASIVIVIFIMSILSLITLSMVHNSNREQRQALDRQLNSQAFYAAESGVNDAVDYVLTTPTSPEEKTDCNGLSGAASGDQFPGRDSNPGTGADTVIGYSCVLYDRTPEILKLSSVGTDQSDVIPISTNDGSNIQNLTIAWREAGNSDADDFSGCPNIVSGNQEFPPLASYGGSNCEAGVLRMDLIKIPTASTTTRQQLIDSSFIAYAVPDGLDTAEAYGTGPEKKGIVKSVTCNNGGYCKLTITGVGVPRIYLHLRSIYKANEVAITGTTNGANPEMQFKDAQIEVDSTGRANDVLKRIATSVPLYNKGLFPEYAIQTADDICKLLSISNPNSPPSDDCD